MAANEAPDGVQKRRKPDMDRTLAFHEWLAEKGIDVAPREAFAIMDEAYAHCLAQGRTGPRKTKDKPPKAKK